MLQTLRPLPPDPILGLIGAYDRDRHPSKVDLGAGVYRDASGTTPILRAVRAAERQLLTAETTKSYVSPPGDQRFLDGLASLVFGGGHPALRDGRVGAVQTPGGCGALRLGAELIARVDPDARLWVPTPTWGNHVPLLGDVGLAITAYPYYDSARHTLDDGPMLEALAALGPSDVVVLHGCCHNPCGADLARQHWEAIADLATDRGFTPFVDLAYHGLGDGLDDDAYGVRVLAERCPDLLVAYSCSKNFGLYRERTGMIGVVTATAATTTAAGSQLNAIARGIWSMPPAHGAAIAGLVLDDADLRADWEDELGAMRSRLSRLRQRLADALRDRGIDGDHVARERGLFSVLDVTPEQAQALRTDHSVYLLDSGRINVAGISDENVGHVADALVAVTAR